MSGPFTETQDVAASKGGILYIVDTAEPVLTSWMRDVASFGGLVGSALALNTLMPPSGWLNAGLATAWLLWMIGKAAKHRVAMTPDQAREWLDARHPRTPPTQQGAV